MAQIHLCKYRRIHIYKYLSSHYRLFLAGALSSCAYLYLALITRHGDQPGFYEFGLILGVCALLSFWVSSAYLRRKTLAPILPVLLFAVLFRLIGIWGEPIFEDDFYRYLWDGRMLVETGNPYELAPSEFFTDETLGDRFEDILSQINHPYIATVYGPMNQWLFGLSYLIAPGELWPIQLMLSIADILVALMLLRLASVNWVLLYAWCPLLIKEIAFTAHPDVLGVTFLVGALITAKKERWLITGALLGLAVASKIFALILVPFILRFHWRGWFLFLVSALVVSAPFGVISAWLPEGLSAMARDWLFNAPIYYLLSFWLSFSTTKALLLGVFVVIWGLYLYQFTFGKQRDAPFLGNVRADILFGIFFLCAPVLNAWYLVWLIPFGVLYPSMTIWATSLAIGLAYASGINLPDSGLNLYDQPAWAFITEIGIICLALIVDICRWHSHKLNNAMTEL